MSNDAIFSSLLLRFTDDEFTNEIAPTIGVDFKTKKLEVDGNLVKLAIWVRFFKLMNF